MRCFVLRRDIDTTGISGTGDVAVGVVLPSGRVVVEWLTRWDTVGFYRNIDEVQAIHGHGGQTVIVWQDETEQARPNQEELTPVDQELLRVANSLTRNEFHLGQFVKALRAAGRIYRPTPDLIAALDKLERLGYLATRLEDATVAVAEGRDQFLFYRVVCPTTGAVDDGQERRGEHEQ